MMHHRFTGVKGTTRRAGCHPDSWKAGNTAVKIPIGAALTCDDYRCQAMVIPSAEQTCLVSRYGGGRRDGSGPGRRTGRWGTRRAVGSHRPPRIFRPLTADRA